MPEPRKAIDEGVPVLRSVFGPYGFDFKPAESGQSSGGRYASGMLQRAERKFEFHVRHSLVTYRMEDVSIGHESYRRMLGVYGRNRYRNCDDNMQHQFETLAFDVADFCQDFLSGCGEEFMKLASEFSRNPNPFRGLP